jgi:hypothetical protein
MNNVTKRMGPMLVGLLLCTMGIGSADAVKVKGQVINGTLDKPEGGVAVQLVYHSAASAEVLSDTTGSDGRFSFTLASEPGADVPVMLSAEYEEVPYRSDRVTDLSSDIEIKVYESTDQDTNIEVISHHLIVDAEARQATQIIILQNTGDRTYKTGTGHGHGVEVPLPNGITEASSEIPGVHTHGQVLVDSRPVPPGRMQLAFTTPLPADGRYTQRLKYATPSIDAFITPSTAEVSDLSMQDLGQVTMGEREFRRLMSENVPAGGEVAFTLRGVAPAGGGTVSSDPFDVNEKGPWALGGLAVGALLALAYLKMGSKDAVTFDANSELGPEIRRAALIEQIADLDDRLETGNIKGDDHAKRRDALKAEVIDLTKAAQG